MPLSSYVAVAVNLRYANIVGAGTNTIKIGSGRLHNIIINSGGTSAIIYDSPTASGIKIGTINLGSNFPVSLRYELLLINGLTIVTTGAASDLTIVYE